MNLPYPVQKNVKLSYIWLLVTALTMTSAVRPSQMVTRSSVQMQVSPSSAMPAVPEAVPVPVPLPSQVVDDGGDTTAQMSATSIPAVIHPVPEPVATPPGINALP